MAMLSGSMWFMRSRRRCWNSLRLMGMAVWLSGGQGWQGTAMAEQGDAADADILDQFHEVLFVLAVGIGLELVGGGNLGEIVEDLAHLGAEIAVRAHEARGKAAREPVTPVAQRANALAEGAVVVRQQWFEGEILRDECFPRAGGESFSQLSDDGRHRHLQELREQFSVELAAAADEA